MPHRSSSARRPALCDDVRLLASADPDAVVVGHIGDGSRPAPDAAPPQDAATTAVGGVKRDFVASDGTQWCVHERDASGMAGAHGPRCLVFETGSVLRVVWHYPHDWRALDDAALEALSERA